MRDDGSSNPPPTSPCVEVRGACDLRCAWCNHEGTMSIALSNEVERVAAVLADLVAQGRRAVTYGVHHTEPTTFRDFPRIVARGRALGLETQLLSTSGMVIADRDALACLRDAGLTGVILTVPGPVDERTDVVLGRSGAAAAKLRAVEACATLGLRLHLVLALVRPTLHGLDDVAADLARFLDGNSSMHALVLDRAFDERSIRHRTLWPSAGEILWVMERLRRVDPTIELQGQDIPSALVEAVGSQGPPRMCEIRPVEPPLFDAATLRAALDVPTQTGRGDLSDELWCGAAILARLARTRRPIAGFVVTVVRVGDESVFVDLQGAGEDRLECLVEDTARAEHCYLRGRYFGLSYRRGDRLDDPRRIRTLEMLHALLERGVAGER